MTTRAKTKTRPVKPRKMHPPRRLLSVMKGAMQAQGRTGLGQRRPIKKKERMVINFLNGKCTRA